MCMLRVFDNNKHNQLLLNVFYRKRFIFCCSGISLIMRMSLNAKRRRQSLEITEEL